MPDESKRLSREDRDATYKTFGWNFGSVEYLKGVIYSLAKSHDACEEALRRAEEKFSNHIRIHDREMVKFAQAEARIVVLEEALPKIREAIRHTFGGMHPTSALWGNSQYDEGHTSGVLAALTAFDTEVAKQQALAQPTAPQGASE